MFAIGTICLIIIYCSFFFDFDSFDINGNQGNAKGTAISAKLGKRLSDPGPSTEKSNSLSKHMADALHSDRKFLLTACTMVRGEAPYIVEWIEFLRLQGVERFVIYDDNSADNITLLNDLYAEHYPGSNVHVIKSIVSGHQAACFQHCVSNYGKNSAWILVADVDEFVFSPTFDTLKNMLIELPKLEAQQNRSIDVIHANCTRFSTFLHNGSRQQHRFQYRLDRLPDGRVVYRNGCGLQQITNHTRRGPDPRLAKAEAAMVRALNTRDNGCFVDPADHWNVCWQGPGKSLFRPEHVRVAGVHYPHRWDGPGLWSHEIQPPIDLAWCFHYYLRSAEDALDKARYWNKSDPARMLELSDARFWNKVEDSSLHDRWGAKVAEGMRPLVQLGGECPAGRE